MSLIFQVSYLSCAAFKSFILFVLKSMIIWSSTLTYNFQSSISQTNTKQATEKFQCLTVSVSPFTFHS